MVLDDVLGPRLRVVFCGTAPGTASARAGAYYAGPGNRFWPTLHAIGLTPTKLEPHQFRQLLTLGIGLTDLSKTDFGSDADIGTAGFDAAGLTARLATHRPAFVAFNGKQAARHALGRPITSYGAQPERLAGAAVWALPSTSGLAVRYWDIRPWTELAAAAGARHEQQAHR